jgi:hypothetical protein
MNTQDKWQAEERAAVEVVHSLFDLGDLFSDFMPFWATILIVAVVALGAVAIKLFGQD